MARPGYTEGMETTTVNNWTITGFGRAEGDCMSCDHCGRAIRDVVTITHAETSELNRIGTGCAVKYGFPPYSVNAWRNRGPARTTEITEEEFATLAEWEAARLEIGQLAPWSRITDLLEDLEADEYVNRYRIERALVEATTPPVAEETEEYRYLADMDGVWVAAKAIPTRYGMKWGVLDGTGDNIVEWVPYMPKRSSTLAKYGYQEVTGVRVVGDWNASAFAPLALVLADA